VPAGQFFASAQSRTFCSKVTGSNGFSKNLSSERSGKSLPGVMVV
jgi:hypothetical protein